MSDMNSSAPLTGSSAVLPDRTLALADTSMTNHETPVEKATGDQGNEVTVDPGNEVTGDQDSEVPGNQDSDTQGDRMDIDRVETMVFKLGKKGRGADLPREMLEQINNMDAEQYTDSLEFKNGWRVSTADVFDLRGADVHNKMLPPDLQGGKKIRTMIWFEQGSSLVGQHMELSADYVEAFEVEKEFKSTQPPKDECIKVKFHLDTQAPHIEICTFNSTTGAVMATRIHADEISWNFANATPDTPVEARIQPLIIPDEHAEKFDDTWTPVKRFLKTTKHTVVMAAIKLVPLTAKQTRLRSWEGISDEELVRIRANPTSSVRDQLVTKLDAEDDFTLLFSARQTKGLLDLWTKKFASYFNRLCAITKHYGTFWFYRRQVEIALGNANEDEMVDTDLINEIKKPGMPKVNFVVPRFLVREWSATVTTSAEGEVSYTDIKPHAWAPLNFPPSFPDANIAAFLLKLAIEEERAFQTQRLRALVHSGGGSFFRARYTHMTDNLYLVHVYVGRDKLVNADVKLPGPGVRIQIKVDRELNDPPQSATTATLSGVVIDTNEDSDDTFVCVCDLLGPKLALATGRPDYATIIDYIVDDLPYQRQMNAISVLQRHEYNGQGPDIHALIFNHARPKGTQDPVKAPLPYAKRAAFIEALSTGFPFGPDPSQLAACIDTVDSESGMTTIVGPPGCGKTEIAMRIGSGKMALAERVMYVAPTNAAVHTLVDKFVKHNSGLKEKTLPDNEWVLFTGAHCKIGKALRLQSKQLKGDEQFTHLNNTYVEYLRSAEQQQKHPHYEHTMGYKLLLNIRSWASNPCFDIEKDGLNLHQMSKRYLDVAENLQYYEKADAKKARADQATREETLAYALLKQVRVVFCTMSSSAHDMMLESGHWDEIIVDEAAREVRSGVAVFLASMLNRFGHITWSGDHMQGGGVVSGSNANTGYNILVRNVFAELADVLNVKGDSAPPKGAFTLQRCYRMSQQLIDWSSATCYGGLVKSDPSAGQWNMPLRNTLQAFWSERLPAKFRGGYEQIVFDVTDHGIKSEQLPGSTSRHNTTEATQMAYWMVELLEFNPPADTADRKYVRVKGSDIAASSNFVNMVVEMKKQLQITAKSKSFYVQAQVQDILCMMETIGTIQGKERPISLYCTVVAVGHLRLDASEDLPIGFVADVRNFNVAMTRQRVARYVFGAFKLFSQAISDKRKVVFKYGEFFGYVHKMETSGFVLTLEEARHWQQKRQKPGDDSGFSRALRQQATYADESLQKPKPQNPSGMHNVDSRSKTTAKGKANQQAPANTQYGGKRDAKGSLILAPGGVKKKPNKRGSRSGKKIQEKRKDNEDDGPAGAAGALAGAAA